MTLDEILSNGLPLNRNREFYMGASALLLAEVRRLRGVGAVEPVRVLSREDGIERCARAGYDAHPIGTFDGDDINAAVAVLSGGDFIEDEFARAVRVCARALVASGECPALADEPAIRATVTP